MRNKMHNAKYRLYRNAIRYAKNAEQASRVMCSAAVSTLDGKQYTALLETYKETWA